LALIEKDSANPQGQIDPKSIHSPSDIDNDAALQMTVGDTATTDSFCETSYWALRWREADFLYQSPPGIIMWEGTFTARSNVTRFVVAETLNSILPQILNGLYYESPAFKLRPRPSLTENATRAITELEAIQLDQMQVRNETEWGLFSALLFGTGIWKWGFKAYTKKVRKYVQAEPPVSFANPTPGQPAVSIDTPGSDQFKKIDTEIQVYTPTFENRDIRYVLVDPGCRVPDIRKAKFVIDRLYLTYRDLIRMAEETYINENGNEQYRYDLPSEAEIKSWFEPPEEQPTGPNFSESVVQGTTFIHHAKPRFEKTTKDPLDEPLEVLERWDNDKVITVLQRSKVIRNEPNEFGAIPFFSVNWWNIPDAFWGLGLGRVIGVEQRVQAGLINACLDLASLIVNPMFVRLRGANIQEQQIRQRIGGILTVDGEDTRKAFTILEQPVIPPQILEQITMSQSRVEMTSGANQALVAGASTTGSGGQIGRSGTGAAGLIQATMNRIGGFAEAFVRQVYEPLLYKIHELNVEKLPASYIRDLLGDKLGPDFQFNPLEFKNASAEFEVLAGSHLAAKQQMAQSLFLMIQIFENAPLMQQLSDISFKKVNIEELFHMIHDLSGFKNYYEIIVDMTPQEVQAKKQQQQMNSPMAKAQATMAVQNNQSNNQSQIVDQQNDAKIVRDMFREIAKRSAEPEALLGVPAATGGFGANESS